MIKNSNQNPNPIQTDHFSHRIQATTLHRPRISNLTDRNAPLPYLTIPSHHTHPENTHISPVSGPRGPGGRHAGWKAIYSIKAGQCKL